MLYIDFLYYRTQHGKKFVQACDFVHYFADKIIAARKKALVSVMMDALPCLPSGVDLQEVNSWNCLLMGTCERYKTEGNLALRSSIRPQRSICSDKMVMCLG